MTKMRFAKALKNILPIFVLVTAGLTSMILPGKHAHAASLPTYRFSKSFGENAPSSISYSDSITTDASGNVYVTGYWSGTEAFNGPGGSDIRTSSNTDAFLTKYNADGSYGWTKTFDVSAAGSGADGLSVAVDKSGNIYLAGDWAGTVVFDGAGGSDSKTTTADDNAYLTKYSASGTYLYTKVFAANSGNSASGDSVTTDNAGNVYVGSYWKGTVVFDGVGGSDSKTSANDDSALTKFNANGSYAWTKVLDTTAASSHAYGAAGVAVDSGGNIYTVGNWQGTVVFDGPGGSHSQTSANGNSYLIKYDSAGSFISAKTVDTSAGGIYATGLAVDSNGNTYVSGECSGTIVFDGPGGSDSQPVVTEDAYLTKYNSNGTYGWTKTFDTTLGSANGFGVATDIHGHVYLTGVLTSTVITDGVGGSDSHTTPATGDVFVTQYNDDGSYGWTRTADSSGGGVSANNSLAVVAADTLGNIFVASDFHGTVIFDGPGGTDSKTTTDDTAFVLSYHVYDPPAAAPGAPDTGFGVPVSNSLLTFAIFGAVSLVLGLAARRKTK